MALGIVGRCYVICRDHQYFRGFCQDAGVNYKSHQIICVTRNNYAGMLSAMGTHDYIVFLAHWDDGLLLPTAADIVWMANRVSLKLKSDRAVVRAEIKLPTISD